MKSKSLSVTAIFLGVVLSSGVFAQGRHDEKPHAANKPATAATASATPTGGRHDAGATTHGAPKAKAKSERKKADPEKAN